MSRNQLFTNPYVTEALKNKVTFVAKLLVFLVILTTTSTGYTISVFLPLVKYLSHTKGTGRWTPESHLL